MNKYEKAIKYFEEHKAKFAAMSFEDEAVENTGIAIEALKKQVPRSLYGFNGKTGRCQSCGSLTLDGMRCNDCGQATDGVLTACVSFPCTSCANHREGRVCEYYAAKTDEIRRIHEEG